MLQPTITKVTALALQEHMVALIRAFGLHRPDETPCGQPVAVAEAHALMELTKCDGLSQNALCARLQLVKSTVSRMVSSLVKRGWVERQRDERDGRAVTLHLTDQGRTAARQLAEARQAKFTRLLERIPEEEREHVMDTLNILVEAMHAPA